MKNKWKKFRNKNDYQIYQSILFGNSQILKLNEFIMVGFIEKKNN